MLPSSQLLWFQKLDKNTWNIGNISWHAQEKKCPWGTNTFCLHIFPRVFHEECCPDISYNISSLPCLKLLVHPWNLFRICDIRVFLYMLSHQCKMIYYLNKEEDEICPSFLLWLILAEKLQHNLNSLSNSNWFCQDLSISLQDLLRISGIRSKNYPLMWFFPILLVNFQVYLY